MSTSFVRRAAQAATLVALAATAASAQPVSKDQPPAGQPPAGGGMGGGRGMGGGGARQMQMMMEGITLSAAQQAKVDSITKAYQAKMPQMQPGMQMSDEDRQKMRAMNTERMAAIKAVLTADQQKTWDANAEKMRANMPQRPGAL